MTLDAFRCLRAMGEHADLFDLGAAQAEAAKVAAALLGGAIAGADTGKLRAIGEVLGGEAFDELAKKVKPAIISAAVERIEGPATPKRTAAVALERLKEIARGIAPSPRLPTIDKISLDELQRHRGSNLQASLDRQKGKARAALKRLDPHFPGLARIKPENAISRLLQLAAGAELAPEVVPPPTLPSISTIALDELRRHRGADLQAALERQKTKARAALMRLDQHFPALAKIRPDGAVARLLQLAEGAEPVPEVRLPDLDAAGLRRAHADLGALFEPWLAAQKKADLKAAVERIDPQRARGRKPAASEHPSILREIAGGGALLKADDDVDPIGRVRFTKQDG